MRRAVWLAMFFCATFTAAQEPAPAAPAEPKPAPVTAPVEAAASQPKLVVSEPSTLMSEERIPHGARVYVAPMPNGFDNYITAGLEQKKVPVVVVADRTKAEFEISGVSETEKAGWAKMLFLGSQNTNETASVKMTNLKTGAVVFAYSVKKTNSVRGKQSAGESCAKHIKQKIID